MRQEQKLSQLEILSYMYSRHLVSPSNTVKALENAGVHLSSNLTIGDLIPFDQDHFGGVDETELCINLIALNEGSNVLDVGSGIGGPARYIAHRTGCTVTGIEIQPDRFETAEKLTSAVNLGQRVSYLNGDFCQMVLPKAHFTHIVSFLCILHMIDKKKAFRNMSRTIKKHGHLFIEDYYRKRRLTNADKSYLLETISCPNLLSLTAYTKALEGLGFKIIDLTDMTDIWRKMAEERVEAYNSKLIPMSRLFGIDAAINAINFAEGVLKIFHSGMMGGVRLIGERI